MHKPMAVIILLKDQLKKLRIENKKTQQDMADFLGITRPAYTAYETGNRQPDYETLQKIADFYEVSVDYLLGRTNVAAPIGKEETRKSNFFYFDKEGLTDEDIEYLKESVEIMKERARKRAAEKKKNS